MLITMASMEVKDNSGKFSLEIRISSSRSLLDVTRVLYRPFFSALVRTGSIEVRKCAVVTWPGSWKPQLHRMGAVIVQWGGAGDPKTTTNHSIWLKDLKRPFSKGEVQMTNAYMKKCSAPVTIIKVQLKITEGIISCETYHPTWNVSPLMNWKAGTAGIWRSQNPHTPLEGM